MSEDDVYERLEDLLKSPYDPDEDGWNAILRALSEELGSHEDSLEATRRARFVDDASEEQLDFLADMFGIERRSGETLDSWRSRIKVALRSRTTSATVDDVREVISVLTDLSLNEIGILEPDELTAELQIEGIDDEVAELDMTDDEFIDIVEEVMAAGVAVGILLEFDLEDPPTFDDDLGLDIEEVRTAFAGGDEVDDDGRVHLDKNTLLEAIVEDIDESSALGGSDVSSQFDEVMIGAWMEDGSYDIHVVDGDEYEDDVTKIERPKDEATDTKFSDDDHTSVVEQVMVAVAGHGRGELDVANHEETDVHWDEPIQVNEEEDTQAVSDDSRHRVDLLSVATTEDGKFDIDLWNVKESEFEDEETDTEVSTDSLHQTVEEVMVAAAGHGRGQLDVADDGGDVQWSPPEEVETAEDQKASTDLVTEAVDEVSVAHYEEGRYEIDVVQVTTSEFAVERVDTQRVSDTQSDTVETVKVGSAGHGRGQIDVSDDGGEVEWQAPTDAAEETSDLTATDDVGEQVDEVDVSYIDEGRYEVDVSNVLSTLFTDEQVEEQSSADDANEQVTEVLVGAAESGVGQIDVTDDGGEVRDQETTESVEDDDASCDDVESIRTDDALVTSFNHGLSNIDVIDDGETAVKWTPPTDIPDGADSSAGADEVTEVVEEVTEAYAQEARANIDVVSG